MLGFDAANAIAEPTVSMSPFMPVKTGTAPRLHASVIQSSSLASCLVTSVSS